MDNLIKSSIISVHISCCLAMHAWLLNISVRSFAVPTVKYPDPQAYSVLFRASTPTK